MENDYVKLPEIREYASTDDRYMDAVLAEAVRVADKTGNDYLAEILSYELGSFYYSNGRSG